MVWYFVWPAPHPKYVHPPGTTINFFHLRVYGHFGHIFSRHRMYQMRSYTRPWCSERSLKCLKCLFMHFWVKKILENFHLNPKGKVALTGLRPLWDDFSSAKMFFQSRCETSSKHPRRWFKVQRTRLKPFLISEAHLGRQAAPFHLDQKRSFWQFFRASNFSGCAWLVQILFGAGRTPSGTPWVQSP